MLNPKNFPLTKRFPLIVNLYMYPSREGGAGITIQGQGSITLTFEETKDPNIAKVRLEDTWVKLPPTRIPFDIDQDGVLECVDLGSWRLGNETFDLGKSGGEYNLKNGHILLKFNISLRPDALGPLGQKLIPQPVHLEIKERGWLDPEMGRFRTQSGFFSIPEGPLENGVFQCVQLDTTGRYKMCPALVNLNVFVSNNEGVVPSLEPGWGPPEVWICPKTPIVLRWDSKDADEVLIKPDVGLKGPEGDQWIPDPTVPPDDPLANPIDRNMAYYAETRGPCDPVYDHVDINVLSEGSVISLAAGRHPFYDCWFCTLNEWRYDARALVDQVQIRDRTGEVGLTPESVRHRQWKLQHFYAGATHEVVISDLDTWTNTPVSFFLPGEYYFYTDGPPPPPGEENRQVYFELRPKCL